MSTWHESKKEDLSIDEVNKELNVYVTYDDSGNIYTSIKIQDLIDILRPYIE